MEMEEKRMLSLCALEALSEQYAGKLRICINDSFDGCFYCI